MRAGRDIAIKVSDVEMYPPLACMHIPDVQGIKLRERNTIPEFSFQTMQSCIRLMVVSSICDKMWLNATVQVYTTQEQRTPTLATTSFFGCVHHVCFEFPESGNQAI